MSRAAELGAVIRAAMQAEHKWLGTGPQDEQGRDQNTPWMPFSMAGFIALLAEALPEVTPPGDGSPPRYFEIGAGPGTKMLVARELAHLDVHGIELDPLMAAEARAAGLDVITCDALVWPSYAGEHLIWFNRVYRGAQAQDELEARVWRTALPGAVVMCANLEAPPPPLWFPVLDDWQDGRRGIWLKPSAPAGS